MADEEQEQISHISYKDYKKKLARNPKQSFVMFLSAFFVLLLVFLGFAKLISPDVDINLGEEDTVTEEVADGSVDSRLKEIQQEDEYGTVGAVETTIQDDGKVVVPKTTKNANETSQEEEIHLDTQQNAEPQTQPVQKVESVSARVVVGFYPTAEQAEVAKEILQEAGMGISPFIRKMGTGYTLQIGVYSSKETAVSVANELLIKNYPARVIVEQK